MSKKASPMARIVWFLVVAAALLVVVLMLTLPTPPAPITAIIDPVRSWLGW
jgi:hypothetical protein